MGRRSPLPAVKFPDFRFSPFVSFFPYSGLVNGVRESAELSAAVSIKAGVPAKWSLLGGVERTAAQNKSGPPYCSLNRYNRQQAAVKLPEQARMMDDAQLVLESNKETRNK